MKALVINVATATERMAFQRQQLDRLGIKFLRILACEIKDKNDTLYLKSYDTWERPLSLSEVSCFLSHQSAWDIIIKENVPMLILEDDAFLTEDVPCQLQSLEKLNNIDYVNLEARGNHQKKCISKQVTETCCGASLLRLYQGRSGAAAYILWPNGAKKLIQEMKKKGMGIADKHINSCYSLLAYQVEPASAIQLDQCEHYGLIAPLQVETSIQNAKATVVGTNFFIYLKYRYKRLQGQLNIATNQLRNSRHCVRRPIVLSDKFNKL